MSTHDRWQPYPAYKNSGVNWLEDIPTDWSLIRFKFAARLEYGDSLPADSRDEGNVPVYGSNGVVGTHSTPNTHAPVLIIGRKGSYGKVNLSEQPAFAIDTTYYIDSRSSKADLHWLFYVLQMLNLDAFTQDSAVPGLGREFVHEKWLPHIDLTEQRTIATFLDSETAWLDALVAKQERLIELLKEKRAALISHAVTKGLDPTVPMKDSGIPAVGQIPVHWEVRRNKWVFQELNRRSTTGDEELLSVSHITGVTPRSEKEVYMFMAESMEGYKLCYPGDLVVNTMWAWMGALGVSEYEGIVSPSYHVYKLRNGQAAGYVPKYLDLLYRTPAYVCEITRYSKGIWSSRLRLYPDAFFDIQTITPPLPEQQRIIDHISEQLRGLDALVRKCQQFIERLQEYRTALISAAVTGKIDVRETQAPAHTAQNQD